MNLVALEYGQVVALLEPADDERREKIRAEDAGPVPFKPGRPASPEVQVTDGEPPAGPRLIV